MLHFSILGINPPSTETSFFVYGEQVYHVNSSGKEKRFT